MYLIINCFVDWILILIFHDSILHNDFLEYAVLLTGLSFDLLSLLFLIVGCLIQFRLKKYFPDFYNENKNMLWFATYALSASLIIRGALNTLRYFSQTINIQLYHNETLYNYFTFLFCDIVPICFQLSTLIFGYIRKKKEDKYRLEVMKTKDYNSNSHFSSPHSF